MVPLLFQNLGWTKLARHINIARLSSGRKGGGQLPLSPPPPESALICRMMLTIIRISTGNPARIISIDLVGHYKVFFYHMYMVTILYTERCAVLRFCQDFVINSAHQIEGGTKIHYLHTSSTLMVISVFHSSSPFQ